MARGGFDDNEKLDFGSLADVDHLLQQGVAAHFGDRDMEEIRLAI